MNNKTLQLSRRAALLRLFLSLVVIAMAACVSRADITQPIRVACVGDSITYGAGLKNRDAESYPYWLGRWMGPGYDVHNFGRSGATLLRAGDLPYVNQPQHDEALAFSPDIVIIMLGTNDSKHHGGGLPPNDNVATNWLHKADFVSDYEALIAEFRAINPKAKIYVCCPPPCFPGRWGIDDNTIHHEVNPLVRKVARSSHAKLIDMYKPFIGKKDLFPDTVHPNAAGAKMMAAEVYHALTGKKAPENQ
ncbi:MAG TPA: GDSL-type esterase/lipase family protein [Alphaproteobacteria bacterium]|nr:GDSL-type esterase/lipase family protein [Alphaproteobacteria bacterium]